MLASIGTQLKRKTLMSEEVKIAGSRRHALRSDAIGQRFLLNISLPPGYKEDGAPYPVVYVSDGAQAFLAINAVVPLMQLTGELKQFITVGITYDVENARDMMTLRTRDLTHCVGDMDGGSQGTPEWMEKLPPSEPGGAQKFLAFINEHVKPFIQNTYNASAIDQCYAGYSLGGLFGLYTLFNQPDSFNRYIIGSPSIWWGKRDILSHERQYAEAHKDLNATVYMCSGRLEEKEEKPDAYCMVSNMTNLANTLEDRHYQSLYLQHQVIDDETHLSGHPLALIRGLRKVFSR